MLSYFKLATAALLTFGTLSFAQDVTLTIDGTSLNYESTADIGGFQFDHDGCATNANGGDAVAAGFSIACTESMCLGFSFSGSFIPPGSGTLIDLGSECSTLSGLSDGGGPDPTVSILSPQDGSSIEGNSIDVQLSSSDMGDGDHFHAYLDGSLAGMFYTENFSITAAFGDHTLDVAIADGSHTDYDHEGSSDSITFSNYEAACDDVDADGICDDVDDCVGAYDECGVCNGDGIAEGACDCSGNVLDECGVCGGNGASMQDCWFDGDGDGCFETLDPMMTCSCEWEGGSSTGGNCGTDGCTDMSACNYNPDATDNDGSCTYAEENYDCDGN